MSKTITLINVKFKNDILDHQLDIKMSPLSVSNEEDIIGWIAFLQHAFDTKRRSRMIPEKERRRIHLISQILAATTAEPEDDTVEDTLNYADLLLVAKAHSQNEEYLMRKTDKIISDMFKNEKSQTEEDFDSEKKLDERITDLNKEFDEKMVKTITRKLDMEKHIPSLYKK